LGFNRFEHIARAGKSAVLREMALEQMLAMNDDPSPKVRNEVAEALSNVRKIRDST